MSVGLVWIFYNPLAPSQKFHTAVPILNFFKMVVRQPRKSLNLLMPWLNSYKDVYSTDFLVYEFFLIDELSAVLVLHLFDNTIIFILSYPCFLFQTFTMTSIPSFNLYSLISSKIYTQLIYVSYPKNHLVFTIPFSGMIFSTFMLILHYSHVFTLHNYRVNQKGLKQVHDNIFGTIYRY